MKAKRNLGMGLKKRRITKKGKGLTNKRKNKNVLYQFQKKGGFLPLLFPILGALGGGAAGIAKAVKDAKANQAQLAELKRHNLKYC